MYARCKCKTDILANRRRFDECFFLGHRNTKEGKKRRTLNFTHFDIIADVARLSRSYPPSEPDMVDADQSVAADLTRSNARLQQAKSNLFFSLEGPVSTAKR